MKWNEVTWYSRIGVIVLCFGIIPSISFYVGVQYEKLANLYAYPSVRVLQSNTVIKKKTGTEARANTSVNGTFLSIENREYTGEAQQIVEEFYLAHKDTYSNDISDIVLMYYDDKRVILGVLQPTDRPLALYLLERGTWNVVGENEYFLSGDGLVESSSHLIGVDDERGVAYFKSGDEHISFISNSALPSGIMIVPNSNSTPEEIDYLKQKNAQSKLLNPNGETYVKEPGMGGGTYDISYDEITGKVKVGVYSAKSYQKVREVEFTIP